IGNNGKSAAFNYGARKANGRGWEPSGQAPRRPRNESLMRIAAAVLFAVLLAGLVGLAETRVFSAVDVSSAQLLGALDKIVASRAKTGDTPIRMIDAGGYNVGVCVLY